MVRAIIYTAPKCPHSQKLKEFLKETGIDFEEKCVLTNPETFEEVFKETQQKGIPVTIIGGDVFVGFDRRTERRIKRTLGA
ncbi:MAG: glutathione S-transferase N-terminal domain-containing protein [Candidatus Thorarchaeota archaeon]|nr:glutathione S-transferase N-terminal domain-containing protein [Candidatus Thorarchaeota archaeon]